MQKILLLSHIRGLTTATTTTTAIIWKAKCLSFPKPNFHVTIAIAKDFNAIQIFHTTWELLCGV